MTFIQEAREYRRKFWPDASRKAKAVQSVRLTAAKRYMEERGIVAVNKDSAFEYARSQGVVLQ